MGPEDETDIVKAAYAIRAQKKKAERQREKNRKANLVRRSVKMTPVSLAAMPWDNR